MALEDLALLVPELEAPLNSLIRILQVIGGIIGVYVLFWFVNMVINARRIKILKRMLTNLEEINAKLSGKKVVKK